MANVRFLMVTDTKPARRPITTLKRSTKFFCEIYLYRQTRNRFKKECLGMTKAKKNPAFAGFRSYDFRSNFKFSSSSCAVSIGAGASIITSLPELFLGKAIKSLMVS